MIAISMPGKHGDLLWSLATAKYLAEQHGPADFYMMPKYSSLRDLIEYQEYINEAIVLDDWEQLGEVPGAQPWQPPTIPKAYDRIFHLGFQIWPSEAIIDFIAHRCDNIILKDPVLPYIIAPKSDDIDVCIGFSQIYDSQRANFRSILLKKLWEKRPETTVVEINPLGAPFDSWMDAADHINSSKVFIGDNSALHVLAHGLGKPVILAESNKDRRQSIFLCPYGQEYVFDCENILERVDDYISSIVGCLY